MMSQTMKELAFLSVFLTFLCAVFGKSDFARAKGYNDAIDWVTLEDGYSKAASENKPIMLLIHKSWCGACKALKPKVASSDQMEQMSKNFVMVNVQDEEEPNDQKYAPDGGYIPRILFMKSNGEVMTDVFNTKGNAGYKYYYSEPDHIVHSMNAALKKITDDKAGLDEL